MVAELLNEYIFGDMRVRYLTDREEGQTGLMILPADMPLLEQMPIKGGQAAEGHPQAQSDSAPEKSVIPVIGKLESLVHLKLTGDISD